MDNNYQLVQVNDRKSRKRFLELPVRLYRNEKNWIRPLDQDVEKVFDPKKNKSFRSGECARWILLDQTGQCIGRIAAFYDKKTSRNNDQPTGGIGFFDCVNQQEAASFLFDHCKHWLQEKGMEAMDGPVNFGDRNMWWGLLADGFTEPNYCVPYNFPYYKQLFENYGFLNFYNQYTYHRKISMEGLDPVIKEKADRIGRNPDYRIVHLDLKKKDKFIEDFTIIYNKAWSKHSGTKNFSLTHARALFKSFEAIMDPRLLWTAYYKDEPIAFFLMLPEINQIIKKMNGKMHLINKGRFLWFKTMNRINKALGLLFGVIPEFQGKGMEGAISMAFAPVALHPGFPYREMEWNWIGDFNPTMMKLAEQIGARISKTHITYRYLFDREKTFNRARPIK